MSVAAKAFFTAWKAERWPQPHGRLAAGPFGPRRKEVGPDLVQFPDHPLRRVLPDPILDIHFADDGYGKALALGQGPDLVFQDIIEFLQDQHLGMVFQKIGQ
jgi:hypothetical protein